MEPPPFDGTLMERLGIELLSSTADEVVARMPVRGNTQPFGALHGGATASLCETVASIGALLAGDEERVPVGIALSINHLRTVDEGWVTAAATAMHSGSSIAVWDVSVADDDGNTVAASRVTLSMRKRR